MMLYILLHAVFRKDSWAVAPAVGRFCAHDHDVRAANALVSLQGHVQALGQVRQCYEGIIPSHFYFRCLNGFLTYVTYSLIRPVTNSFAQLY